MFSMRRTFIISLLLLTGLVAVAQNYPSEWTKYTSDAFYHDIESATTKQTALELARTNLARQIQVKVKEVSKMDKNVTNGHSNLLYSSTKSFSTEVDMDLAETKTYYNEAIGKYYVLAFIDKVAACNYYENEVKMLNSNASNALTIADNYINTGNKQKAKAELQKVLNLYEGVAKPFFWLNVFGFDRNLIHSYLTQAHNSEQAIKQRVSELEYGTTYCVISDADFFGKKYLKLSNEVKGKLAASGCNFVDEPTKADIVIRIKASARKYNEFQGAFFTYVDAAVSIVKNATGQVIFEDEVSVKGCHTISYNEAARDGYKEIVNEITKILKQNIKL